jgi:hypothetical protein
VGNVGHKEKFNKDNTMNGRMNIIIIIIIITIITIVIQIAVLGK